MALSARRLQDHDGFDALVERAYDQGYLTLNDIQEICQGEDNEQLLVQKMTAVLRAKGIKIRDGDPLENEVDFDFSKPHANLENVSSDDTVSLYLREMALTPLLTMDEEVYLAQQIEKGVAAKIELIQLSGGGSAETRNELMQQIELGQMARDNLIRANTRLVVSIARRYIGHGVQLLDLIQEGNLGLMKAVEKFEYRKGYRFSTYATWWIRQSITRAVADQGRTIRVPVHMSDRLRQLYKVSRTLEQSLGRSPTIEELAKELELDSAKVEWMLQVSQIPISLESPVGDEEDSEFGMFVEDQETPSPAQSAQINILRERVEEALASLPPREARVLRLRFGLGHDRSYTLEEVGQKFGLTRERIRQIEGKALRRLRQPAQARLLNDAS